MIPSMSILAKHLAETGITQAEFARSIETSQSFVSQLCSGHSAPSLKKAVLIARVTNGAVPVESWSRAAADGASREDAA